MMSKPRCGHCCGTSSDGTCLRAERHPVWPVRAWYAARQAKAVINYGASVGHIPARIHEMHDSGTFLPRDKAATEVATPEQQAAILADLDDGMQQGALG